MEMNFKLQSNVYGTISKIKKIKLIF